MQDYDAILANAFQESRQQTEKRNSIKRWVTRQVLGYSGNEKTTTHTVWGGQVELVDRRVVDAWELVPFAEAYLQEDGLYAYHPNFDRGTITFEQPRIDVPARKAVSDE